MIIIYNLGIWFYTLAIRLVSPFNLKAKQWINGRKNIFARLKAAIPENTKIAWFHSSSLGEFEQGRPVIEGFRKKYPDYKILLTFFSPSGYEIRKNYEGADFVFYLPADTKTKAQQFIQIVKPKVAFFIKYEFWFHYLNQLSKKNIPTYIFSAIFRDKQLFFKGYGKWYRKMLQNFTKIYVQNDYSKSLLEKINITNTEVGGDTRFDRVYDLVQNARPIPLIEQFTAGQKVIIAGSTWEKDEQIIAEYMEKTRYLIKWIIAPHEIHKSHIDKILTTLSQPVLKFSEATSENINSTNILLIDSIGILSSVYRYGIIAYIGGGFGNGIHNTLEAATYSLPVVFGPNYKRFREACDLIDLKSGFSINNYDDFSSVMNLLLEDENFRNDSGISASDYVTKMRGGTQKILNELNL